MTKFALIELKAQKYTIPLHTSKSHDLNTNGLQPRYFCDKKFKLNDIKIMERELENNSIGEIKFGRRKSSMKVPKIQLHYVDNSFLIFKEETL